MEGQTFRYPSTRYSGSKRRLLEWIWSNIEGIKFDSVLDAFGGTGSVSLLFKRHGKKVYYNDLLKFNQIIGTALIENKGTVVTDDDINCALSFNGKGYPDFIQKEFKGVFYLDSENAWLDKAITNFSQVKDKYKRAILLSALFQACLAKRPFNLFHRANLYLRTNKVDRSFGNKTTWEHPFEDLVRKYAFEYNRAIFDNGKENKVIGGYDALNCPDGVDLVYLDPPYFSRQGTNYLAFYHFLERLANYDIHPAIEARGISGWVEKSEVRNTFRRLIERFQNNIIVLSYQSEGIPSKEEIFSILKGFKRRVWVFLRPHRYVLSPKVREALLFVAR